jgi:hypothetical protein
VYRERISASAVGGWRSPWMYGPQQLSRLGPPHGQDIDSAYTICAMTTLTVWRRCSSCKAEIGFTKQYWVCSVSTCTRTRTGYFFCSVPCWEAHLPMMRHREAFAVEQRSPTAAQWQEQLEEDPDEADQEERAPVPEARRKVVTSAPPPPAALADADDKDILIVVSKLKKYIRDRSGMNTSDNVMALLSDHVRLIADLCIQAARDAGRKTVLDRDVPPTRR